MSEDLAEYDTGKSPVIYKKGSGLFADKFLLPSEDKIMFHQLREELSTDLSAKGTMELALVENIATIMFRIKRVDEDEMILRINVSSEKGARAAEQQASEKLTDSLTRGIMDKEMAAAKAKTEAEGSAVGFWVLRDECPETWKRLSFWLEIDTDWLDCMTEEQYNLTTGGKTVEPSEEEEAAVEAAKDAVPIPEGAVEAMEGMINGNADARTAAKAIKALEYHDKVVAAEEEARAPYEAHRLREQAKLTANKTPEQKNLIEIIDYINAEEGGPRAVLEKMLKCYPPGYTAADAEHDIMVGKYGALISSENYSASNKKTNPREVLQRRRSALDNQLSQVTKELRATQEHRWKMEKANAAAVEDDEIPEFLQGYQ